MATKIRASSLIFTLLALLAIAFCIRLGFWQFDRYELRHTITREISAALQQDPLDLNSSNQSEVGAWSKVQIDGAFAPQFQRSFRGHYFQDRYGLEVLSLFLPKDPALPPIWVDRGWIETRRSAEENPPIPAPPSGEIRISGILRAYDDPRESRGLFFALPAPKIGRIDELSLQRSFSGETFHKYLKIQERSATSELEINPLTPPGEGPHLAYAIQWWIFALLIAGTRIALFRGERRERTQT
jgi:cytochrome oxidase assembly protein ShyY1